jgi:transposase
MRPTKKQERALMEMLIASRKMYNACLQELITHYEETGTHMHLYEQDTRHGKAAHPDLPAVVVDTTLKRLHRSFTNFFAGRREGRKVGFPRFKGANAWNTIQLRDATHCLDNGRFKAPKQMGGRIRVIVHRPLEGTFKFARIVLRPSGWYVQVRRFGVSKIAPQEQEVESESLLGHPTYLASKDKGENSMLEKRIILKMCKMMLRKSCTQGETYTG